MSGNPFDLYEHTPKVVCELCGYVVGSMACDESHPEPAELEPKASPRRAEDPGVGGLCEAPQTKV